MFHVLDGGCWRLLGCVYHNDSGSNETGKAPYLANKWQPLFQEYGRENRGNNHRLGEKLDTSFQVKDIEFLYLPRHPKVLQELPWGTVSIVQTMMSLYPYLNKSISRKVAQFTQYHCLRLDCIFHNLYCQQETYWVSFQSTTKHS